MSKRKGVSADEKRARILELFYEKKDFFQLKELEKMAPKEKGVIAQSVKDVVQNLVDDGLVDREKIGTSIYFWAFPSKALAAKKRRLNELNEKIQGFRHTIEDLKKKISDAKAGREDTKERTELIEKIATLRDENDKLKQELKKYEDSDPEAFEKLKKETKEIKESANRWIDNIFAIKDWCRRKFNIDEQTINKQFNIPPELDYID